LKKWKKWKNSPNWKKPHKSKKLSAAGRQASKQNEESKATMEATEGRRQTKLGRVVSNKMQKTVVVVVEYLKPHPLYRKIIRKSKKFHAHDEENTCQIGDMVRIEETRPLSKTKNWQVIEIVKRGEEV
jgi:small subunit ribosomal protein S17